MKWQGQGSVKRTEIKLTAMRQNLGDSYKVQNRSKFEKGFQSNFPTNSNHDGEVLFRKTWINFGNINLAFHSLMVACSV
jgi:hypothetical protein